MMAYILGIDSSSHDISAGVVIDQKVLASDIHLSRFTNVPNQSFHSANQDHLLHISQVVGEAIHEAGIERNQIDAVAVSTGPGLLSALECGLSFAKGLSFALGKPLIGIPHSDAHIYSLKLGQPFRETDFPVLVLVTGGTVTELLLLEQSGLYTELAHTQDDTIGETIEKVGKTLGFDYPAGIHIEQAASKGNGTSFNFLRGIRTREDELSFNGLKVAVLNMVSSTVPAELAETPAPKRQLRSDLSINDAAASFQDALFSILATKLATFAEKNAAQELWIVGGVASNQKLRQVISKQFQIPVRFPPLHLCGNSGAAVAAAGFAYLGRETYHNLKLGLQL